jgi:hypothetical protein
LRITGSAVVTTRLSSVVMNRASEVIAKAQSILALSLISILRAVSSGSLRMFSASGARSHRDDHAEVRHARESRYGYPHRPKIGR